MTTITWAPLTDIELRAEWSLIYFTRIGSLCGKGDPTPEQKELAAREADEHVKALQEDAP